MARWVPVRGPHRTIRHAPWLLPRWRWRRSARRLGRLGSVTALVTALDSAGARRDPVEFDILGRSLEAAVRDQATIDAVCERFLAIPLRSYSPLRKIIDRHGWLPSAPGRRAMLLYVLGHFDRYAQLDPDGTLLAAAYLEADHRIRRDLLHYGHKCGQLAWLRALTLQRVRRLRELSHAEWDDLIHALAVTESWPQLWSLARQAPPLWSARLLDIVALAHWHPDDPEEHTAFDALCSLARAHTAEPPSASLFEELAALEANTDAGDLLDVVSSADGTILAALESDGSVAVWRLPAGTRIPLAPTPPHTTSVAITAGGEILALGGRDGVIRLWTLPSGEPAGELRGHRDPVRQLKVSADGTVLVSGGLVKSSQALVRDGTVRLWSLPSGTPLGKVRGRLPGALTVIDELLVTNDGGATWLSRLPAGRPRRRLGSGKRAGEIVPALTVSPAHTMLVTATNSEGSGSWAKLSFVRLPDGDTIDLTSFPDATVLPQALAMSPDGSLLAGVNHSNEVNTHYAWLLAVSAPDRIDALPDPSRTQPDRVGFTPNGWFLVGGTDWHLGRTPVWRCPAAQPAELPIGGSRLLPVDSGALLFGRTTRGPHVWRYRPSALESLARKPVSDIDPAEIEALQPILEDSGDHALAAFITALVRNQ